MGRGVLQKVRNFRRYDPFVRAWFVPVWLGLGLARAIVLLASFRRLAPWLGQHAGAAVAVPLLDPPQQARAGLVSQTVRLAARHTPWESNCFPQAIVARALLGVYGVPYVLCFGVAREPAGPAGLRAHAWVASGPVAVSGGDGFADYAVVACYASRT